MTVTKHVQWKPASSIARSAETRRLDLSAIPTRERRDAAVAELIRLAR